MEAESRKRRRELETMERLEHDRLIRKLNMEKSNGDGCCGGGGEDGEEEETGRGVFDFPWLKGDREEGGGVMLDEEWTPAKEEYIFLGSLERCSCDREEVEMEGGLRLPLLEDTSTSISTTLSLVEEEKTMKMVALGEGRLLLVEVTVAAACGEADGDEEEGEDNEGAEEDADDDPKTGAEDGGLLGELAVHERRVVYRHFIFLFLFQRYAKKKRKLASE